MKITVHRPSSAAGGGAGIDGNTLSAVITASQAVTYGQIHRVDASSGNVVLSLPASAANRRLQLRVLREDVSANTVTVLARSGESFDGSNSIAISLKPGGSITIEAGENNPQVKDRSGVASKSRLWLVADLATAPSVSMTNFSLVFAGAGSFIRGWGGWTAPAAANRPMVVANVLNGLPALQFDGVDDYLEAPANYLHQFMFVVYRFRNTATITNYQKKWMFGHGASYHYHTSTSLIGEPGHMHANLKHAGGVRIDGGEAFNPNSANYPLNTNFHILEFLATANVETQRLGGNDRGIAGRFFEGDVSELYGFAIPPVYADRWRLEGSVAWITKLNANLPASHVYRNVPPLVATVTY